MKYFVTIEGETHEVEVIGDRVTLDGRRVDADLQRLDGTSVHSLLMDGESHLLRADRVEKERWILNLAGRRVESTIVDERTRAIREMTGAAAGPPGPRPLKAPMPGLVVKIEVEVGDEVRAGQGLVIVEAMKMENELKAEGAGRVAAIHAGVGDAVEKDQVLVDLDSLEEVGSDG
jgi:biotin carboxyl carrier protein